MMNSFSDGLTFDPDQVLPMNPKIIEGVFPADWIKIRVAFPIPTELRHIIGALNEIAANCNGRLMYLKNWCLRHNSQTIYILCFEDENDAILLKIRGFDSYIKKVTNSHN